MGKCMSYFLILILGLIRKNVVAKHEEDFFNNFLFEEPIDEAQCDQMQLEMAALDSNMILDTVPQLNGKWVSQDCEVRPGPGFLLRSYSFTKNNSFRLVQHFYEDESCILPSHTVVARGELIFKGLSWATPGARECDYSLLKVVVIPHTTEMTEGLSKTIKHQCLDGSIKTWKPHKEYVIYSLKHSEYKNISKKRQKYGRYKKKKIERNIDCLSVVGLEFNELMLVRTQIRSTREGRIIKELLLGNLPSRNEAKFIYKPTAFQVPLLKSDEIEDCVNCQLVHKGTERSPPHLLSKPQLPPLPHGQWISQRCEIRSFGMFLTRRFSFDSRDRTWQREYKFYADPICTESVFSIFASGKYIPGVIQTKEKRFRKIKTGTNFDFIFENASLTLHDPTLRDTFNAEKNCGVGPLYIGVPKDLSTTSGCSVLGIVIPSTEHELIKLEINHMGTPLLFMGLPVLGNKKRNSSGRPTSYQAPLIQCSIFPRQNMVSNYLESIYYARTSARSSSISNSFYFHLYWLHLFYLFLKCSNNLTYVIIKYLER